MFNNYYFLNLIFYEIMWKNIVAPDRPQMTIWRMRTACCIPKSTNTNSQFVIFMAFSLQNCLHERASMLSYTYTACLCLTPCLSLLHSFILFRALISSLVSTLWAGQPRNSVSILGRSKGFLSSPKLPEPLWSLPSFLLDRHRKCFP